MHSIDMEEDEITSERPVINNYTLDISNRLLEGLQEVSLGSPILEQLALFFKGDAPMKTVWSHLPSSKKNLDEGTFNKEAMSKLLEHLHKIAKDYETSRWDNHLRFAALLKRIALFFVGKLALKEV